MILYDDLFLPSGKLHTYIPPVEHLIKQPIFFSYVSFILDSARFCRFQKASISLILSKFVFIQFTRPRMSLIQSHFAFECESAFELPAIVSIIVCIFDICSCPDTRLNKRVLTISISVISVLLFYCIRCICINYILHAKSVISINFRPCYFTRKNYQ